MHVARAEMSPSLLLVSLLVSLPAGLDAVAGQAVRSCTDDETWLRVHRGVEYTCSDYEDSGSASSHYAWCASDVG